MYIDFEALLTMEILLFVFKIKYECLCPVCKMAINMVFFVEYSLQVQEVISII